MNALTENDKFEVLSHGREIDANLQRILKDIEDGDLASAKCTVLDIQRNALGLQKYLSATLTPNYYNEYRLANSATAAKVFAIQKLFEAILQKLPVADIFRCYGVSRTFRDIIDASTKLQTCLIQQPDTNIVVTRFPFRSSTISCRHERVLDDLAWLDRKFRTDVTIAAKQDQGYALPTIGIRWRKMLIRQPPVYEMSCSIPCYPQPLHGSTMIHGD